MPKPIDIVLIEQIVAYLEEAEIDRLEVWLCPKPTNGFIR